MSDLYFGSYEPRDLGDFCRHRAIYLKMFMRVAGSPLEAVKDAAQESLKRKLAAGDDPFLRAVYELELAFYSKLQAKLTHKTDWNEFTVRMNDVVAENNATLQKVPRTHAE